MENGTEAGAGGMFVSRSAHEWAAVLRASSSSGASRKRPMLRIFPEMDVGTPNLMDADIAFAVTAEASASWLTFPAQPFFTFGHFRLLLFGSVQISLTTARKPVRL